ncbi:MAG TPA: DUF4328 domain-containing protein [Sphingomonas sp.]|nr:DUF4328 domain-containing protein [Sphingomonas sp.]
MTALDALWAPLVLLIARALPSVFNQRTLPAATIDVAEGVLAIATVVMFMVWIYRAGRTLVIAGFQDLEFSAASRVWWFLVPFANLVKPFQGMRELDNASRGYAPYDQSSGLVNVWWGLWLLNGVASNTLLRIQPSMTWRVMSAGLGLVLAAVTIGLVIRIAAGQAGIAERSLEQVFA